MKQKWNAMVILVLENWNFYEVDMLISFDEWNFDILQYFWAVKEKMVSKYHLGTYLLV